MCTSRFQQVVRAISETEVETEDVGGSRHRVSLLALDGAAPRSGDWLVVHSGYAIGRAEADEAEAARAAWWSAPAAPSRRNEANPT